MSVWAEETMLSELGLTICTVTSLVFVFVYFAKRYLCIKPSIQVLFGSHVLLQWPISIRWSVVEGYIPLPGEAFLLIHGFVVLGLAVSIWTWRERATDIFEQLTLRRPITTDNATQQFMFILLGVAACAFLYLTSVEISRLGLVVGFTNPDAAQLAREESYKLIANPVIRYAFALLVAVLAPLASVFSAVYFWRSVVSRKLFASSMFALIILALLIVVSVTGARYFATILVLNLIVAWAVVRRFEVSFAEVAVAVLLVLSPPILLTALRQGQLAELGSLLAHYVEILSYRIFVAPTDVAMWYMHYSQVFGELGVSGIPRLASLFGIEGLNAPNLIGLRYYETSLLSINANGGYLFSYYLYFGILALPICLGLLWSLDFLMVVLSRLKGLMLLAVTTGMTVSTLSFQQSDFTTTLVTHGFAVIPIVGLSIATMCGVLRERSSGYAKVSERRGFEGR